MGVSENSGIQQPKEGGKPINKPSPKITIMVCYETRNTAPMPSHARIEGGPDPF